MARRLKLGQLLISKGLLSPEQLASALAEQEQWGSRLGMTLVRMKYVEEDLLVKVLSQQLQLPVARIAGKRVKPEILERVPAELAEKYRCLPLFTREEAGQEVLFVGMDDPSDLAAIDELSFRIEETVKAVLVAPTELEEALHRNYHEARRRGGNGDSGPGDSGSGSSEGDSGAGDALASSDGGLGPVGMRTAPVAAGGAQDSEPPAEATPDLGTTLPPINFPVPDPEPEATEDSEAETDPRLPSMPDMLAGFDDDPVLGSGSDQADALGDTPPLGTLPDSPALDESDEDPVLGGLDEDPVLGGLDEDPAFGGFADDSAPSGGDPEDSAGMSFSAASEEPLADLAKAPFGDSDPDLGGFSGGPFGSSDDDVLGGFADEVAEESPPAPPEQPMPQPASNASLEATVIIKALAQLLVEKGVIGRDEFAERVRRLAAKTSYSD